MSSKLFDKFRENPKNNKNDNVDNKNVEEIKEGGLGKEVITKISQTHEIIETYEIEFDHYILSYNGFIGILYYILETNNDGDVYYVGTYPIDKYLFTFIWDDKGNYHLPISLIYSDKNIVMDIWRHFIKNLKKKKNKIYLYEFYLDNKTRKYLIHKIEYKEK